MARKGKREGMRKREGREVERKGGRNRRRELKTITDIFGNTFPLE